MGAFWPDAPTSSFREPGSRSFRGFGDCQRSGLDVDRFRDPSWAGGVYRPKFAATFDPGLRAGVNGTRPSFVDGVRFDGNWAVGPSHSS